MTSHAATVGVTVIAALVMACGPELDRSPESATLSKTDLEVMRTVLASVIRPRLDASTRNRIATIISPTRTIDLRAQPPTIPPAPPPFSDSQARLRGLLDGADLTPEEQTAWRVFNRRPKEIPDLGLPDFSVSRDLARPAAATTVTISAPAYVSAASTIVYVDFRCGGTCGEGWLIRLTKVRGLWSASSRMLWIS